MSYKDYLDEYKSKLATVDDVLNVIKSGDRIFPAYYGGEPAAIMRRLHEIAPRVKGVKFWKVIDMEDYPVMHMPEISESIEQKSLFYGKAARDALKAGHPITYEPSNLNDLMRIKNEIEPCNVFMVRVSPMDEEGYFGLGTWVQVEQEVLQAAETVIIEVDPKVPITYGYKKLHISQVDYITESNADMPVAAEAPYTDTEAAIGNNIAELIHDGDCIQLGLGGTSNAAAYRLLDKRHLGIHTEMFTESMKALIESGAVDNSLKQIDKGISVASFAYGSQALYDFINGNKDIHFRSGVYVNDPFVISKNNNAVSINTTLQIDLTGQICSETMGPVQFSGSGGAFDFAYGAFRSQGGRGIIAIQSTAKKGTVSRIQPILTPGSAVTIPRNVADNVVTEYGVARLRGKSTKERAEELIRIAHPDFRDELRFEARKIGLL